MVLNLLFSIFTATSTSKKTVALTSQQTSRFTILKFNNFKIQNSSSLRYASFIFFKIAKFTPKTTEGSTIQQTSNFTMNQCQNSVLPSILRIWISYHFKYYCSLYSHIYNQKDRWFKRSNNKYLLNESMQKLCIHCFTLRIYFHRFKFTLFYNYSNINIEKDIWFNNSANK
jgi:hypothetical protein